MEVRSISYGAMLTFEIAVVVVLKLKDGYTFTIPDLFIVLHDLFINMRFFLLQ